VHRALVQVWPAAERARAGCAAVRHTVDKAKHDFVIESGSASGPGIAAFDARRSVQEIDIEGRAAVNLPRSNRRQRWDRRSVLLDDRLAMVGVADDPAL